MFNMLIYLKMDEIKEKYGLYKILYNEFKIFESTSI